MLKPFVHSTFRQTRTQFAHIQRKCEVRRFGPMIQFAIFQNDTNAFTTANAYTAHTYIYIIGHICVNNVIVDFNIKYTFLELFTVDKKAIWVHSLYICDQNSKGNKNQRTQSEQWQCRH